MLLPSQPLRDLSERFDICLSGKIAPTNCDIRYRQLYWLMVFDAKGELRSACKLGEQLGVVMKQGFDVPNAFVEIVEQGIKEEHSLEQLQKAYIASKGSQQSFVALQEKVAALRGVAQMAVARFLADQAHAVADPELSRARGLLVEADACSHQVINHQAFANLRSGIVGFLHDHPDHPIALDLLQPLVQVGLKYSFDATGKCSAYASQWLQAKDKTAARQRVCKKLLALCHEAAVAARVKLKTGKPDAYDAPRLTAFLGDPKATLRILENTKTFGVFRPIHAEWRRDAEQKARRSSKM